MKSGHAKETKITPVEIKTIPISQIRVINPRSRSKKIFAGLVDNIAALGLKRPITVTENGSDDTGVQYDLICGQGRVEAFQALGESAIPAIVVEASPDDRFLMSLVENLARRQHSSRDLLNGIRILDERGYSSAQIAGKTNLNLGYIGGILHLLKEGEERLIAAVEKGWLPMKLATEIARADDAALQNAMTQAYSSGLLRGEQLMKVRRLIDRRQTLGKRYVPLGRRSEPRMTPRKLFQTFQNEVRRQRLAVKKVEVAEQRLLFVVTAFRRLLGDDHFRTLLRAENIADMPQPLADRLTGEVRP